MTELAIRFMKPLADRPVSVSLCLFFNSVNSASPQHTFQADPLARDPRPGKLSGFTRQNVLQVFVRASNPVETVSRPVEALARFAPTHLTSCQPAGLSVWQLNSRTSLNIQFSEDLKRRDAFA